MSQGAVELEARATRCAATPRSRLSETVCVSMPAVDEDMTTRSTTSMVYVTSCSKDASASKGSEWPTPIVTPSVSVMMPFSSWTALPGHASTSVVGSSVRVTVECSAHNDAESASWQKPAASWKSMQSTPTESVPVSSELLPVVTTSMTSVTVPSEPNVDDGVTSDAMPDSSRVNALGQASLSRQESSATWVTPEALDAERESAIMNEPEVSKPAKPIVMTQCQPRAWL